MLISIFTDSILLDFLVFTGIFVGVYFLFVALMRKKRDVQNKKTHRILWGILYLLLSVVMLSPQIIRIVTPPSSVQFPSFSEAKRTMGEWFPFPILDSDSDGLDQTAKIEVLHHNVHKLYQIEGISFIDFFVPGEYNHFYEVVRRFKEDNNRQETGPITSGEIHSIDGKDILVEWREFVTQDGHYDLFYEGVYLEPCKRYIAATITQQYKGLWYRFTHYKVDDGTEIDKDNFIGELLAVIPQE